MVLFRDWLLETARLQREVYGVDYVVFLSDAPDDLRKLIEYMRWNMLAIDDELAEMRQGVSWKPWQHDEPYVDRQEVISEAVDVLHFVGNILAAVGCTDDDLNAAYLAKMEKNRARQSGGYYVKQPGVKCVSCQRAIDDVGASLVHPELCVKCLPLVAD